MLDLGAIAAYPRPPNLASLPVGVPSFLNRRRATRTMSQDSGEFVQIPADQRPWTAQLQPGTPFLSPVPKGPPKDVVGLASATSNPNVAAGIRIGDPLVENEPRPPLKSQKDQDGQTIDQANVQEAAARVPENPKILGRTIETQEGQESSSMNIKIAIKLRIWPQIIKLT